MKSFVTILLVAKIGFICNEGVTALKLLEKGFSKEDLALAALLDFPFQIVFGYYAAKWSSGPKPLRPVCMIAQNFFCHSVYCNLSLYLSSSVALCFLWPFDLCYSGHVGCILLP